MAPPADGTTLPDAGTKLRMVLDYVPCEACLAHPVDEQELLCSLCARLDRQVAVRVRTRTTVLIERPSPPSAPIVIAPASAPAAEATPPADALPAPPAPAPARPIVVRFADDTLAPPGSIDVVVEPLAALPLPALAPLPVAAAAVAPIPAPIEAEPEAEPELEFDDIISFVPARDEFFDYRKKPVDAAPAPPARVAREEEPPPVAAAVDEPPPPPEDDFVFRPPSRDEPAAPEAPAVRDDVVPAEEVPVEPAREVAAEPQHEWAPPPDFLADEEPAPPPPVDEPAPEPIYDAEPVTEQEPPWQEERPIDPAAEEDAVRPAEEEILELEQVEDDEDVVEMEIVEEPLDAPAPPPRAAEPAPWEQPAAPVPPPPPTAAPVPAPPSQLGDLYRVRGIDAASVGALQATGLTEVSHLSGRDAADVAARTSLPLARVQAWIHVADLVVEVGVPMDAANALVAAGIAGPKGLADADADEVADRVAAFGGATVAARDIKRWKRRA